LCDEPSGKSLAARYDGNPLRLSIASMPSRIAARVNGQRIDRIGLSARTRNRSKRPEHVERLSSPIKSRWWILGPAASDTTKKASPQRHLATSQLAATEDNALSAQPGVDVRRTARRG
jgi:hypothetical protein